MLDHRFNQRVLASDRRLAMPIAVSPGLRLIGATVRELVTDPAKQSAAQAALHERYGTPFLLSAMDLSAEGEAFGCTVAISETEVPTVTGRLVVSMEQAQALALPKPGDARTGVYLETVRRLRQLSSNCLVLAGCIGPFSLAARLVGVSEALELTLTDPDLMHLLIDKSGRFLAAYAQAFRQAGADGLILAEPAAGLLSPRSLSQFSSAYVRRIAESVQDGHFALILHNCAAKLLHLPAILETGLTTFHFGAPMDLAAALRKVPKEVVLCGNLDPTAVFCQATPEEVSQRTAQLLDATAPFPNYVISSGCDLPPSAKIENLDAFYEAVKTSKAS
jgi:uroporphyrinogen decarboxylase